MTFDWVNHKKHREAVAEKTGQWVGLLDADGIPLMDVPPIVSMKAPIMRNSPSSLEMTVATKSTRGVIHPIVNQILADKIAEVDAAGALVPLADQTRFISIERPGVLRQTYWIVLAKAQGSASGISAITTHGVDMLKLLSRFPTVSMPETWTGQFTRFERDWVGPENARTQFRKPRDIADMKLRTEADRATLEGPAAVVIRKTIQDSLTAAFRVAGITTNLPIQVVPPQRGDLPGKRILLRRGDDPLWETIAPVAMAAGVEVYATMWLPGDRVPDDMDNLTHPTVLVGVYAREDR